MSPRAPPSKPSRRRYAIAPTSSVALNDLGGCQRESFDWFHPGPERCLGILGGRRLAIGIWGGTAVGVEAEPAGCLLCEFLLEQCPQTLNGARDGVAVWLSTVSCLGPSGQQEVLVVFQSLLCGFANAHEKGLEIIFAADRLAE